MASVETYQKLLERWAETHAGFGDKKIQRIRFSQEIQVDSRDESTASAVALIEVVYDRNSCTSVRLDQYTPAAFIKEVMES